MGVFYIPDPNDRGDFYADYDVIALERTWNAGGEYFQSRVKTRVFELSCYYEEITIAQREEIIRWLDRRTSGDLIFDDRKYASYHVRPTRKIEFKDYLQRDGISDTNLYSGTFTITFSAYDPFASLNVEHAGRSISARAIAETGLLEEKYTPAAPTPSSTSFVMYNPGTEYGHTIIRFAGSVGETDMVIFNSTTGEKCTLKKRLNIEGSDYIEIDSKTGRIEKVSDNGRELYFAFHDEGYIRLAPFTPLYRNIQIQTTANSRIVTATRNAFNENMVGQYIYTQDGWKYIGQYISPKSVQVNSPLSSSASLTSHVATMNFITITKGSDANVTRFEMICKAEVR